MNSTQSIRVFTPTSFLYQQNHDKNTLKSIVITSTGLGVFLGGYYLYYLTKRYKRIKTREMTSGKTCCSSNQALSADEQGRKLGRTISFTSASMAMGAMPPEANVPDTIINATILFENIEDCPTPETLANTGIIKKILSFERYAGIPVGTEGKNNWRFRECANVDPMKMIRVLDIEGDDGVLYSEVEEHLQDDLRKNRGDLPWWEFLIVRNSGSGMSACILRTEHVLGDGLSLVTLFQDLITHTDGSKIDSILPKSMNDKFKQKNKNKRPSKIGMFGKILKSTKEVLTLGVSKFDDPVVFRKSIGKNMVYSGNRKITVFQTMPLPFIKALKNKANVSINDVLFTALSQAIRDYCINQQCPIVQKTVDSSSSKHHEKNQKIQFRALMPVALPRSDEAVRDKTQAMRNKWVFVSSDMGIGIDNISDRLAYIHDKMNRIKSSPTPYVQWKVQESLPSKLPVSIGRKTVYDTFVRHSIIFSNVPGPSHTCLLAGKFKAVGCQMFFCNLIPQVGILSYNDKVFINMVLDPNEIIGCENIPFFMSRALTIMARDLNVDVPQEIRDHADQCPTS